MNGENGMARIYEGVPKVMLEECLQNDGRPKQQFFTGGESTQEASVDA